MRYGVELFDPCWFEYQPMSVNFLVLALWDALNTDSLRISIAQKTSNVITFLISLHSKSRKCGYNCCAR